ncbi:MAG: C25 family cysteine peptidase [Bacteroidales bacterium]
MNYLKIEEVKMHKFYTYFLMAISLLPATLKAEWVTLNNKSAQAPPQVTLLSDDQTSTVIKIEIAGFDLNSFTTGDKTYQRVDLLTDIFTNAAGEPEVPYLSSILAIPDMAGVTIEVLETGEVFTFNNIYLPPARQSWFEGDAETPYLENSDVYQSGSNYPLVSANVGQPGIFRDFRIARVEMFPVKYNAQKHEIQVASSMTIKVNYGKGEVINPKTNPSKGIAPSFADIYSSLILNYQSVLDNIYDGKEDGQDLILCVIPDAFYNSFLTYAEWKRKSGTDVHLTKFSDIGANASNPQIIKDHVADAYHNWEVPPTYVLLVGDDGICPKKIVTYDYSFPNEDFFVEIDGNDYFPELMIGRFTNESDFGMQIMINKFLLYEQNPYMGNPNWFKKGTVCSNNAYASQVYTKRFAYERMMEDGDFISVDTLMSDGSYWGGGCTVSLNDVKAAINDGRSYLNYRGEGWSTGWSASCYNFSTYDVSTLNNGQQFTFVTSIGCGVAMFDTYGGNCFGEEWVESGTMTNPKGACAFVGPTSNTHTTYNNKIDMGIYVGMFQEGMDTPGQALLRGKMYLYNVYGADYWVEYHFRIYCVLGDPSIHVWKEIPQAINVSHPDAIGVGVNQLDFVVTSQASGDPIPNAELCLAGEDIYMVAVTDSVGKVHLEVTPLLQETIYVTVRGGNVIPYQGSMDITQEVQLVEPDGEPVLDELDGNQDGMINPNEHFDLTFALKNWGWQTANNVQATLTSMEPDLVEVITTSPVSFGNLPNGSTYTGSPFEFFVKPDCPVGEEITFNLHVTSTAFSWDYQLTYEVLGCRLNVKNFIVIDKSAGNSNYRMDPGETVSVTVSLKNAGEDTAPYVTGILSCDDPNITIIDSIATFGTIQIGATVYSNFDIFEVSVSPTCPTNTLIDYTLELYTETGNYPYHVYKNIQLPVSKELPNDYTGPDAYGYYAYGNNDAFFDQTPVYNWIELNGVGSFLTIPPNTSDYTVNVSLPFNFKYYGTNHSVLRVSTDGWIAFDGGDQVAPANAELPHNDDVNNMVGVFWDDLYNYVMPENGIYYYHDQANHKFIIEWDSITHNDTVAEPHRESFQVILLNPSYYPTPTGDGQIICQYKHLEKTESCTVGIENASQDVGLNYVFNDDYIATAKQLTDGVAIKFTTKPPTVSSVITGIDDPGIVDGQTSAIRLSQNNPNPFTGATQIDLYLPEKANISLQVYRLDGSLVKTLFEGFMSSGTHTIPWNGTDMQGNEAGLGVYLYRFQTDGYTKTMKMLKVN